MEALGFDAEDTAGSCLSSMPSPIAFAVKSVARGSVVEQYPIVTYESSYRI
jgi:hypothetical protein